MSIEKDFLTVPEREEPAASTETNSKHPIEIYDLSPGVYGVVVPDEDGKADDALSQFVKANGRLFARLEENSDGRVVLSGNEELIAFLAANKEHLNWAAKMGYFPAGFPFDGSPQLRNTIALCLYCLSRMRSAKHADTQSNRSTQGGF